MERSSPPKKKISNKRKKSEGGIRGKKKKKKKKRREGGEGLSCSLFSRKERQKGEEIGEKKKRGGEKEKML